MNAVEWLSTLVAFDTTSRLSNLTLIKHIEKYLKKHNIASRVTFDITGEKANLFATIPGQDGNLQGGLILSGHTDVVPVEAQVWATDPFTAVIKNDRVYGRGTCDMKGFIAIVLSLIPTFLNLKLQKPLHFAFSYDEEVGCHGVRVLIDDMKKAGIKPAICIVGEPTLCEPIVAHKGIQVFRCRVHGKATHSSLTTKGCNAIHYAAKWIQWLAEFADQLKLQDQDKYFDVPFTTLTTNLISGGTANNIIPSFCEFFFEFRQLPQVDPKCIRQKIETYIREELLKEMRKIFKGAKVECEALAFVPSFESKMDKKFVKMMGTTSIKKVSYATEAGLFQAADIPTIICGPGSIEEAHRPNEFISLQQIENYEKMLPEWVRAFQFTS